MIARYRDGELAPAPTRAASSPVPRALLHDEIPARLDRWDVTGALDTIWDYVRRLNRHVEQTKPWELAKDPDRAGELDRALYELADGLRIAAVALSAYLPETSERILEALGQPRRRRLGQRRVRPHAKRSPGSSRRSRSSRGSTTPATAA